MRSQLPYSGDTGITRSFEPVARKTPPAVNDATAVKVVPWLITSTVKSQDPSMGDAKRAWASGNSVCAEAVEFVAGSISARNERAPTRLSALRLMIVNF